MQSKGHIVTLLIDCKLTMLMQRTKRPFSGPPQSNGLKTIFEADYHYVMIEKSLRNDNEVTTPR